MFEIIQATTHEQIEQVKKLFREYATWLGIDLSFQGFTEELANMPGDYAPPDGRLLLAHQADDPVGCVALHKIETGICEMKRLFVTPAVRGKGLGRLLAKAIIDEGRQLGYRKMRLDTIAQLKEATSLYQSLGFRSCAPYRYNPLEGAIYMELELSPIHVFKVSGTDLDDPAFSQDFAACIAGVAQTGAQPIVVHGGGKELTALLKALQIDNHFVDGLRVTDARTRDAALMTLSGLANKRLVAALLTAGVDALGVSGVDAGLIRVEKVSDALQFVGKPVMVRTLLKAWVDQGLIPVVAPMSVGLDGEIYNVNADHVAGAIATGTDAAMLTLVTNVPAVLGRDGTPLTNLTAVEVEALIADGTVSGGMIPKVRTALEALTSGVKHVRITNLAGVRAGTGTTFKQ